MGMRVAFSAGTAAAIWKTCVPVFKQYRLNPPVHKCADNSVRDPVGAAWG